GIKVVSFDSDAAKDCRDVFINQATTQGIGQKLVEMANELAGGSGEIAILSATPNATNQNAWIDVFKQVLTQPQYANLKLGKVAVTGLGTPNQMREYIKDGTVKKFALWNPADIGYLAAYAGVALVSGQITGAEGQKFKAGKLGEYTIGKDGEIVLGPPTVFD